MIDRGIWGKVVKLTPGPGLALGLGEGLGLGLELALIDIEEAVTFMEEVLGRRKSN